MRKEPQDHIPTEKEDDGMKWVVIATVFGSVIIAMLIIANALTGYAQKAENAASTAEDKAFQEAVAQTKKEFKRQNYDYDLALTPENCENVSGDVDLVLITDANYMDFTRVAINSAAQTKCPNSRYKFHIMTMDISDSDKAALKALENETVSIEILPQQPVDLFYIRDTHVSKTSLLKYYIATALPNLDKVLYLDSDVLVLHDLNKLYQNDISNVYMAAVKDPSWFFENYHVVELNLEDRGFYFNTGVLLMNLAKIREDNLIEKLEEFTNNNFRTYMDQDAYNVAVGDKVLLLPVENNTMNFFFEHIDMAKMNEFYQKEWKNYDDVFGSATIIHFASSKKPLGKPADNHEFFRMLQRLWYKYYTPLPPLD